MPIFLVPLFRRDGITPHECNLLAQNWGATHFNPIINIALLNKQRVGHLVVHFVQKLEQLVLSSGIRFCTLRRGGFPCRRW